MSEIEYNENNYEEKLLKEKKELLSTEKPIILFGTMTMGLIAKKTLDFLNVKIACFCDNNKQKQGEIIKEIQVLSPKRAKEKFPNAKIYICSFNLENCKIIKEQLYELGFDDVQGADVLQYVHEIEIVKRKINPNVYAKTLYKLTYINNYSILPSITVSITTKCTLRCKNCCALIPYFKEPKYFNKKEIIKSMRVLSQSVDAIKTFNIIGGEPLLHPDLVEICNEASKINNVRNIVIITNGTIIPRIDMFKSIKNSVSYIQVSDYGTLSKSKSQLKKIARKNNIFVEYIENNSKWIDLGNLKKRNRDKVENQKIFKSCSHVNECNAIVNGKLYFCGWSAFGTALCIIPKNENDFINLLDDNISTSEMRAKISDFKKNTKCVIACDYCDWPLGKKVPPAIQLRD